MTCSFEIPYKREIEHFYSCIVEDEESLTAGAGGHVRWSSSPMWPGPHHCSGPGKGQASILTRCARTRGPGGRGHERGPMLTFSDRPDATER